MTVDFRKRRRLKAVYDKIVILDNPGRANGEQKSIQRKG